jgi:hypothetical protein
MKAIREQWKELSLAIAMITVWIGFYFAPSLTTGVIAAALFALALLCVVQDRRLAASGRWAQGTVVDHQSEEGCFIPVIEFQDSDGIVRRDVARSGRGVKRPPVGSRVVVVYDPAGKMGCEIDTFWRRSGFAVALCLFGVLFACGAIYGR